MADERRCISFGNFVSWATRFVCVLSCVTMGACLSEDPHLTFDRLFTMGMTAYDEGHWQTCIRHMEKAQDDYKFYKQTIIDCRLECKQKFKDLSVDKMKDHRSNVGPMSSLRTLKFYENIIFESDCVKRCRRMIFGEERPAKAPRHIVENFENRLPYSYLQYCYFKMDRLVDATSAAYTFYLKNPNHQDTIDNIQSYRQRYGVDDQDIVDMERKPYKMYRGEGEMAYHEEDWDTVITSFEAALREYYKEDERCRTDCEGQFDHDRRPDFIHAVADHYTSVLKCQAQCEDKLSRIYVEPNPDFFAEHFHFLQFAYYKNEDYDRAVEAAGTYLLFLPEDEDMIKNKIFYTQRLGYHQAHFTPRQEAAEYYKRKQMMTRMLGFIKVSYESDDDDEEEEISEEEEDGEDIADKSLKLHNNFLDDIEREITKDNPKRDEVMPYMKVFEKIGVKILLNKEELKGPRCVAEGFNREDQCIELVFMINTVKPDKHGVRRLNISEAIELVKSKPDYEMALRVFLKSSERTRHYTSRFFNKTAFYIREAKLVCRDPVYEVEDEARCIPQESGVCVEDLDMAGDEEKQNDFIGVAYLTDNNDSGMYFLDQWQRKQSSVSGTTCGHLVGFEASDRHGIVPSKSQRCAMVVTYTTDKHLDDPIYRRAMSFLLRLDENKFNKTAVNNSDILQKFQKEGTEVVMKNEELHGTERVIADGLVDTDVCSTLINLAKSGAIVGDGYTDRGDTLSVSISPHTDNEIFEGLTIRRAIKLVKKRAITKEAVELYLSASERSRLFVEKFFNLTQPLYFDYTHLVCRTAIEGDHGDREEDYSHPVHGDNCQINPDGSCLRTFPAYVQRDYSAVTYLNEDFEGGEFFFAHPNTSSDVMLKPKCGRIVGFNAADLHGVKGILKGQRCAIAMWYTLDANYKELARIQAHKILANLPDSKDNLDDQESSEKLDREEL